MINKKDIPFDLRNSVEEIAKQHLDFIKLKKEENTFYSFVETDNTSQYYFKIYTDGAKRIGNFNRSANNFAIEFKPTDSLNIRQTITQGGLAEVSAYLRAWLELTRKISETPSIHDDTFEKYYSDYYFQEFKIIDEDADRAPFTPEQQDKIEIYLLSLKSAIENINESVDEEIKNELIQEVEIIRTTLSSSTKTKVMKGVTKVFGKIYKTSKEFAKEVIKEAKKELIKKLLDLGIEYGPKLLEIFTKE